MDHQVKFSFPHFHYTNQDIYWASFNLKNRILRRVVSYFWVKWVHHDRWNQKFKNTYSSFLEKWAGITGGYATQRTHMHRMKEICMRFLENVGHMKSFAPWVQNQVTCHWHQIQPQKVMIVTKKALLLKDNDEMKVVFVFKHIYQCDNEDHKNLKWILWLQNGFRSCALTQT